ncbi:hypothetical protein [Streptomyces nymphaeiformis]|uniref:Uncharacterized protein n=1 Tax=Streptomyces nymphaeiformis TaxID=2663842 RepID=A0A7W7U910_9ACTN|nr:hypothetical protein [Streptomyces nymphaeiformis]MBB4987088.1 hypothetical protein [Streptomyces nymphaeiformis]
MTDGDFMVWTALPGGRVNAGLAVLRLAIHPRLKGPLKASELADWPARLPRIPIQITLRHADTVKKITPGRRNEANAKVWQALLGNLPVRPYAPHTFHGTTVECTSEHAGAVIDTYATAAKAPDDVAAQLESWDHLEAWDHEVPLPTTEGPPPPAAELDFHQQVARLREHPAVLRALGLIVELTLPVGELSPTGTVSAGTPGLTSVVSPATNYEFDGNLFLPASAGDLTTGMLDLRSAGLTGSESSARWEITTFDVDGAVTGLRQAARNDRSSLPHLRSTGLMLVRRGRQADFDHRHARAASHAAAGSDLGRATFNADELLLGYRIDIRPKGEQWAPLCRRVATYRVGGVELGPAVEEGQVKPYAATGNGDQLRADEVVARWSGWSLVLPPPGAPRARQPAGPLDWTFAVEDGTLPELRFGQTYEVRARVADLAGGGLEAEDPAANRFMSSLVAYTRFEPVPPPELSGTELVIRSDRNMSVDQFLAANPRYASAATTLILRVPATTLALAEQHGMLEGNDAQTWAAAQRPTDPASAGVVIHLALPVPVTDRRPWSGPWPMRKAKTLTLIERAAGGQPQVTWSAGDSVATVSLSQAEQITAELSSYLPDNFLEAKFAIHKWLEPDDDSAAAASGGRHPMVTPAREITLIHAVRKPRFDPIGTLQVAREHGQTWTTLLPSPPALNLDPPSTAQVFLTAAWDEWDDAPAPTPATAAVQTITMHPTDLSLPPLRHEFGDTKHRVVTYTVTGTSRFRQYFADDEPDAAFLAWASLPAVDVPSTARPIPPVVLGVRPAFSWQTDPLTPGAAQWDDFRRTRRGGRLQVELARPWYTTGEGESLAVQQRPLGRDPIWCTPESATSVTGTTFHEVWRAGGSWYADVELPTTESYAPFVRLTVARHQPSTLPGVDNTSASVDTDAVAILPDRTLTVKRQGTELHVQLNGIGPTGPRPNVVQVLMEQSSSGQGVLTSLDGAVAATTWGRVPGAVVTGTLNTPLPPLAIPQTGDKLRIYVREIEQPDSSPSSGELAERVVFADYVLGFPAPLT